MWTHGKSCRKCGDCDKVSASAGGYRNEHGETQCGYCVLALWMQRVWACVCMCICCCTQAIALASHCGARCAQAMESSARPRKRYAAFCLSSHCAQHRILHRWPSGALKRNKTLPVVAVDTGASEPVQPDELEAELEALCAEPALPAVNEHVEVRCGH